jgi:predicted nucleic acid-binding protein
VANVFLDTSALAKLYHRELSSDYLERLLDTEGDNRIFVSPLSLVEMESVLATKARMGQLSQAGVEVGRRKFRLDLAKRRLLMSPEFEKRHFEYARTCVAITEFGRACVAWTPCNSRWQCICRMQDCSTFSSPPTRRFAEWRA